MTDTLTATALAYYAANGAALFPCAAGTKRPILKWKDGSTADPVAWAAWTAEGHNLAIDCAKSGLIMLDVDASKVSREQAWQAYHDLCVSWGLQAALAPSTQSARGGWHIPFQRPADLSPADLRGGGTLVKISDIRALATGEQDGEVVGFKNRGYCVAPGSTLDTPAGPLPYLLLPGAPTPHDAPSGLIEAIRLPVVEVQANGATGLSEPTDVANLVAQLDALGEFSVEPDWFKYLGAIKLALGDTEQGLEVARQMTRDDATEEALISRWSRLASIDDGTRKCRIGTMIHRYKELTGKAFRVGKSTAAMFAGVTGTVAAIAAAAGATLASEPPAGAPLPNPKPAPGMPMLGRDEKRTAIGTPILEQFLADTIDSPTRPISDEYPQLPTATHGHGLYNLLNDAITRIIAMAEPPQKFQQVSVHDALGVLRVVHTETCDAVCRKIRAMGRSLSNSAIQTAANIYHKDVERELVTLDEYKRDHKNEIQHNNSDNITVFLKDERLEIRWNAWLERMEIRGGVNVDLSWSEWVYIDDTVVAKLMDWASRTDIRYLPAENFFWKGLISRAHRNPHDPARALLADLEKEYDGVPRLAIWLTATCGVPCDPYHQAVAKNIIGGIVRRIRNPGCKHDTMPIFYGFQGSGKSTMASVLALDPEWFTDAVMLGDESKELVLSLAGKTVSEIGEMGMRGSADANRVKKMLSATFDEGRTAYARSVSKRQRRNIFIGTTNDSEPLTDTTGNRRFLPVHVDREIDLAWLNANIRSLFAEAAVLETAGHSFAIPKDVWAVANDHQEAARSASDMEVMLDDWFSETPFSGPVSYVTAKDLALLSDAAGWRGPTGQRNALMKRLGFRSEKPMIAHKRPTVWVRGVCRAADIPKLGVRYMVNIDGHGRPNVIIRSGETEPTAPPVPRI